MNVSTYDFNNAASKKIPEDNSAVVAANSEHSASSVEGARNGQTDTIEGAIKFL